MKINKAIMYADDLRPNAFDDDVKVMWLSELDGKIEREVFKSEKTVPYVLPVDGEKELLVKHPHSDIYPLYIVAMIDFYNNDIDKYQNAMVIFNSKYDIFAKWYQRNNMPQNSGSGFKNLF